MLDLTKGECNFLKHVLNHFRDKLFIEGDSEHLDSAIEKLDKELKENYE